MSSSDNADRDDSVAAMMLADLTVRMVTLLHESGMSLEEAREKTGDLLGRILAQWGGIGMYLPKHWGHMLSPRDAQIYKEFTGTNYVQLALNNDLSERQVRNIVKRGRLIDSRDRQTDLFASDDEQ